jgi:hypothetical protein
LHLIIGDEAFEPADGDGGVGFAADAGGLALDFLRADAARYGGQVVIFADKLGGTQEVTFGDKVDKAGDVNTDWAVGDAFGIFALEAALRLADGGLFGQAEVYFFEILVAFVARPLGHLLAGYGEALFGGEIGLFYVGQPACALWATAGKLPNKSAFANASADRLGGQIFDCLVELALVVFVFFEDSAFAVFIGFEAVHKLVEVDFVAIEFRAVNAGEFSLFIDSYATAAAHTSAIDHNRVQADDSGDIEGPGQFRYHLHHYHRACAINGIDFTVGAFD